MPKYYVYRYIDKSTNEIVYVGKTEQLFVENRLVQHTDDKIGKYSATNPCKIEFLVLPRKEDMNYIESYLIRKILPKCNTILVDKDKTLLFEIVIPENLWKDVEEYLEEKKKESESIERLVSSNIGNRFLEIEKSNKDYLEKLKDLLDNMPRADKALIREIYAKFPNGQATLPVYIVKGTFEMYGDNSDIDTIINRLLSYEFISKLYGTASNIATTRLFKKIEKDAKAITFYFGDGHRLISKYMLSGIKT